MKAQLVIEGIKVQPDLVKVGTDELTGDEFLGAKRKEGDLIHFKRFVVQGLVKYDGSSDTFKLIIDARGHWVLIDAAKTQLGPWRIAKLVSDAVTPFYGLQPGFNTPMMPTRKDNQSNDTSLWTTPDGTRLAAALLGLLKFEKPFESQVMLGTAPAL